MLKKLIEQVKLQVAVKKACIFFMVFATFLTYMGGTHELFYGSSGQIMSEASDAAANKVSETISDDTSVSVLDSELAGGFMLAKANTVKTVEAFSKPVNEADSPKAVSATEDEEDADDEANAGEKKPVKAKAKPSGEAKEESEETEKKASKKKEEDSKALDKDSKTAEDEESNGFVYSDKIPMSRELQEYTYAKCEERGLEYELILAIIWRESRFNTNAVNVNTNGTRDNGIMQINDVNRKWLKDKHGITDLMDPFQNIDAGTAMLGGLTSKYGSHKAMLAYQYGEGGMARRLKQGITTSHAVEKAYERRDYYRAIILQAKASEKSEAFVYY